MDIRFCPLEQNTVLNKCTRKLNALPTVTSFLLLLQFTTLKSLLFTVFKNIFTKFLLTLSFNSCIYSKRSVTSVFPVHFKIIIKCFSYSYKTEQKSSLYKKNAFLDLSSTCPPLELFKILKSKFYVLKFLYPSKTICLFGNYAYLSLLAKSFKIHLNKPSDSFSYLL